MGKTSIEWTDASWNPIVGCSEVSPGCANCYAARLAATRLREVRAYHGLASGEIVKLDGERSARYQRSAIRWTGAIRFLPDRLAEPASWREPRRIFVCDMGDLFHGTVSQQMLLDVFQAMAAAPRHTYQLLTKRAERMASWLRAFEQVDRMHPMRDDCVWPWPNVWCGVSVENQHFADERIPHLLATPAAVRFISAEPLLGLVDLKNCIDGANRWDAYAGLQITRNSALAAARVVPKLDWVIAGGESGPGARPMDPAWPRLLRDDCNGCGVPFFFKQWGEWLPSDQESRDADGCPIMNISGEPGRLGKKKAGRLLDGREWKEFPR